MALVQQLGVELAHGIGLVRPVIAHGPAAVGLILVDDELVAIPVDAEGAGFPEVLSHEEAHLPEGHAVIIAEGLELFDGSAARRTGGKNSPQAAPSRRTWDTCRWLPWLPHFPLFRSPVFYHFKRPL